MSKREKGGEKGREDNVNIKTRIIIIIIIIIITIITIIIITMNAFFLTL